MAKHVMRQSKGTKGAQDAAEERAADLDKAIASITRMRIVTQKALLGGTEPSLALGKPGSISDPRERPSCIPQGG